MRNKLFLGAAVAALVMPAVVSAQETTSAISGHVVDDAGADVSGAQITVVHEPSGTKASSTTDSSGSFDLRGLRVGGPYTVTVTAPGFPEQTVNGLMLTVGDTLSVPVRLEQKAIIVTATRSGSRQLVEGSQSSFSAAQIQNIVSARRDVRDIVRRDPLAAYNPNVGGVTIAGGNIRTQRFSVDGVQMQDSFGLNYGGLPSTRGIVSLEAIDQLTVKAAPFDISEGNFQGGAVNVVLKSGGNRFHVSAFGDWGGPGITGEQTRDNRGVVGDTYPVSKTRILPFRNYGGSVSGPIIRDKLFFAAAYEYLSEGAANTYGVAGSSAANVVPNLTQAQVDDVISRFGTAGYDKYNIGSIPTTLSEKDKKYSAKLDWNITEGQRFSVTYIHHENTLPNFATGAATGSNSATTPYIQLQSNQYQLSEFTNAVAGQLNSQWTDKLSSEVRVAYKFYRRGQDPYFGTDYSQFAVCLDGTSSPQLYPNAAATQCTNGVPIVRLGPDTPRQANKFHNRQLTVDTNIQLKAGDHTFKLELDHFRSSLYNLFSYGGSSVSAGGTGGGSGAYYFDSLADFSNRNANEYILTTSTTGSKNDAFVDWRYSVTTVGFQDTWRPSPKFTATAGLRYDLYGGDKTIQPNQNFINRYASLYPGLNNTATLDGRSKLQPRFGFNWAPTHTLRVSGGVGLFAGGLSDVFISNNFSNSGAPINSTGATVTSVDILRNGGTASAPTCIDRASGVTLAPALCAAALTGVKGGSVPQAVVDYIRANGGVAANALTNSLDPKFRLPAQWKYNLSATWKPNFGDSLLASGWSFRGDVLYSKAQDAIRWTDLRAQPLITNGVVQVAPDGRPRYGANVNGVAPGSNYDIQLTNTTKGRAWVLSGSIAKELGSVNLSASYTHQDVKDVAGVLTSSTVSSSYSIPTSDPNSGGDYGRSTFEVTHTIRANIDFVHKFFGDNETRFNVNWELRSGQPFSVTMNDNVTNNVTGRPNIFGTGLNSTSHLLYVPDFSLAPTNGGLTYGLVTFDSQATLNAVKTLVTGTALRNYQGKIAPKNLLTGPWYNKVDLNFAQQIPFFYHSKFTALLGIENFLNLLNRNWGTYQDFGGSATVVRVACSGATTAAGQTCPGYTYSAYSAPRTQSYSKPSLYAIRAGVRFDF